MGIKAAFGMRFDGVPVALAPMAGITDLPWRSAVRRFGADLTISEMVASQEMVEANPTFQAKAQVVPGEAVQIAGREGHWMARAAQMAQDQGAAHIDINMGCPAKKVTGGMSGSALMRDLDHAIGLIEAVVRAVHIPVTLKTRLGWDDDSRNAAELSRRAVEAGVQMITIHGRTRCQFYKGQADWAAVAQVVQAVSVPVLVNGDIVDASSARQALAQSGAAGVMVGRGAQGRPWLLAQLRAALNNQPLPPDPTAPEKCATLASHYEAGLAFYGEPLGLRVMRKHLGWYMDDLGTAPALRQTVLTAKSPDVVRRLIPTLADPQQVAA